MSNLVNLESVGIVRGVTPVLTGVSLGVQSGDRIGVLGLNGSGKSTLISVLGGRLRPDTGRVSTAGGARIEVVDQSVTIDGDATVRDVALFTFAGEGEHEWASDASVRGVLDGLGLGAIGLESRMRDLSGGEQRRVTLAAALVTEADLLILDEPTNHLDIEGVNWLAEHLLTRRSALVAVTHDRWFLDAVAQTTWEVVDEGVEIREGGYSDWVFARAERLRLDKAAEERRKNLARKELAWLRRGAPARTSKPRYRIEAAEELIADVPEPRNAAALHQFATRRIGKDVIDLEDVTVGITTPEGARRTLLDDVTFRIGPGDRIGIVGVNGSGKSTLLRTIVGELQPDSGRVKQGKTVALGFLQQAPEELPAGIRLLEAVAGASVPGLSPDLARSVDFGGRSMSPSQLAEEFGFTNAQQWTTVERLSGGQRRRLQLMRILMESPNVLVLDEPTNDLDIDTLTALENLLDNWPGTLIVVSHDRYLVERATDSVYALFGDGAITHLPGGIDAYLRQRAVTGGSGRVQAVAAPVGAGAGADPGVAPVPVPTLSAAALRDLRKELQRLDKRLESLRRKQEQLRAQLESVGADYTKASELDRELHAVGDERDETELAWLEVAEQLEG